jgi:hypothetical protein
VARLDRGRAVRGACCNFDVTDRELREEVRRLRAAGRSPSEIAPPLRAPLSLVQHVVHGAVAFAPALGFDPHPDFAQARGFLGELREPCAIAFGQRGRPLYVIGPYDDPIAVMRTLRAAVGSDGSAVAA